MLKHNTADALEVGSGAARVAAHLRAMPNLALDRHDVAGLIGVAVGAVDTVLDPAVAGGLITIANDGDRGRVWRAGPRLKFWQTGTDAPSPAPAAVPPATPAKKDPRGGPRVRLPALNPADFPVRTDVPPPVPKLSRRGETRYDVTFSDMTATPGSCRLGLPASHRPAMTKAAQSFLKYRPDLAKRMSFVFRELDNDTFGIWHQARTAKPAA